MNAARRIQGVLTAVFGVATLGFAALLLLGKSPPLLLLSASWPLTSVWLISLQAMVAAHPGVSPAVRRVWRWFAVATVFTLAGDLAWVFLGDDSRLSVLLSLCDSLTMAGAMLAFPGAIPERGRRGRMALDLLIVFVAGAVAMWDITLRPVVQAEHATTLDFLLAASSPLSDFLLLIGAAALLMRRSDPSTGMAIGLVAVSMVVYVVVDAVWAVESLQGTYQDGGWVDLGWLASRGLWAAAAWSQMIRIEKGIPAFIDRFLRSLAASVPLVATAIGFFFILRIVAADSLSHGLWGTGFGAVALCVLVLVRQTQSVVVQERLNRSLEVEKAKSDRLLLNVLPEAIARRLVGEVRSGPIADSYREATVLFADIVGFTNLSARTPPERLVAILDAVFSAFDAIADRHGLEKIKTIGDAYMAAAGVPEPRADHVEAAARMALEMREILPKVAMQHGVEMQLRIGLHTGPVVAGVIGNRKFIYDLWGDTVNTASRMESQGSPGTIHVSAAVAAALPPGFAVEPCGVRDIKGKGPMETYLLVGAPISPPGAVAAV
jgi:class 3 adenylate cyclase